MPRELAVRAQQYIEPDQPRVRLGRLVDAKLGQLARRQRLELADAERSGQVLAANAGAANIAELRNMPAEKIMAATRGMRGMRGPSSTAT